MIISPTSFLCNPSGLIIIKVFYILASSNMKNFLLSIIFKYLLIIINHKFFLITMLSIYYERNSHFESFLFL